MSVRSKIKDRDIVRHYSNGEVTIVWQPNNVVPLEYALKTILKFSNPAKDLVS